MNYAQQQVGSKKKIRTFYCKSIAHLKQFILLADWTDTIL